MTQKIVRLAWCVATAAAIAACGSSGGGSAAAGFKARGGKGLSGEGGTGGVVQLNSNQGGNIAVLRSGGIPDLPVIPQPVAPDLGSNPRTISGQVTLESSSFPFHGDDDLTVATGLRVKPGAVLTLSSSTDSSISLTFTAGLWVEGTLRTSPLTTGVPAGLQMSAKTTVVGSSGWIDLSGADAVGTGSGSNGASLILPMQEGIFNQGQITTRGGRGGSGGAGGDGGTIVLSTSTGSILNTGTVDSSGGEGQGGAGGKGAMSQFICSSDPASTGDILSTGRRLARGGNGQTSGGTGGTIITSACQTGRTMSSGVLDSSGGDATEDGPGGNGGLSVTIANSNQLFVAGQLLVSGGKGISSGAGGDGGTANLVVSKTNAATQASQGVFLTAEIDVSGGEGATGGSGGHVILNEAASDLSAPPGTTMVVSGHQSLDASGGEGATTGGGGGHLTVRSLRNSGTTTRIGSVASEIPLYVNGGQGLAGNGGSAGTISLLTDDSAPEDVADLHRALTVTSPMSGVGGEGTAAGGAGGIFIFHDYFKMDIRGAIDASGGRGGSAEGGGGGHVVFSGEGAISTPVINASGGASQANQGGQGGTASVSGAQVTVAAVTLDGGAGGGSFGGGGGGQVVVAGTTETNVTGVCSVRAGIGTPAGTPGHVVIDSVDQTLVDGQYRP